jgi:hypothetical protein
MRLGDGGEAQRRRFRQMRDRPFDAPPELVISLTNNESAPPEGRNNLLNLSYIPSFAAMIVVFHQLLARCSNGSKADIRRVADRRSTSGKQRRNEWPTPGRRKEPIFRRYFPSRTSVPERRPLIFNDLL